MRVLRGPAPDGRAGRVAALAAAFLVAAGCSAGATGSPPQTGASATTPAATISAASTAAGTLASPSAQPVEEQEVCGEPDTRGVVLVVDPELRAGIAERLARFEADLCAAGYFVFERRSDFASPPDLRAYLAELWARTAKKLEGALFIGDYPFAYQWVFLKSTNPKIPDVKEEVVTTQYYEDLDGSFSRSATLKYPKHEYSFDVHDGNVGWEIWVAVLPRFGGGAVASSVAAINRYLDRNHAFRAGDLTLPKSILIISELNPASTKTNYTSIRRALLTGEYAWTPLSAAHDARLFIDSQDPPMSVDQGYEALTEGVADITVLAAHGTWAASGKLDIDWLNAHDVKTLVLWSDACATAAPDRPDNFMDTAIYSPTSLVLVAKGAANDASGMGTNKNGYYGHNIATAIAGGGDLGEAVLAHVGVPLIWPWSDAREYLLATPVLLGDPTIRLRSG
jgi:hypothetical protein